MKYNELLDKYNKLKYEEWNTKEILVWINNLDNGIYKKYNHQLSKNLKDLNEIHLKEFGIIQFGHRIAIMKHIKKLKNYKQNIYF